MPKLPNTFVQNRILNRVLRYWNDWSDSADELNLVDLKKVRSRAQQFRRPLNQLIQKADHRLALPAIGTNAILPPVGSDWSWRPDVWRGPILPVGQAALETKSSLSEGAAIFHDCKNSEVTYRQIRNTHEDDLAPFGLRIDVLNFDGSFLSLAIDLPSEVSTAISKRHVIGLESVIAVENPSDIFARLNVKNGPNTEQIVREMPISNGHAAAEFDLAYTRINEKRVERAWIDLIIQEPELNQIMIRDLTFYRRTRTEL